MKRGEKLDANDTPFFDVSVRQFWQFRDSGRRTEVGGWGTIVREGQLSRVRDGVTAVGFEAGAAANVDNIIRFIIYNKL